MFGGCLGCAISRVQVPALFGWLFPNTFALNNFRPVRCSAYYFVVYNTFGILDSSEHKVTLSL